MKISTKIIFTSAFALMLSLQTQAQKFMGIGTDKPNPRAVLELTLENATFGQGFLPPRMNTALRTGTFQTALAGVLPGMTVYDTDINAYFVWNGSTWDQLALSAGVQSVAGVGGITVTTTGLTISVDGSNFLNINKLITGDVRFSPLENNLTVTGLKGFNISNSPSAINNVLSFNGTDLQFVPSQFLTTIVGTGGTTVTGNNATGYTINTPQGLNTILGSGSITVTGSNSAGFTIAGPDGLNTILGIGGTTVTGSNSTGYTINTPQGLSTILGIGGTTVTGNNGTGYTINTPQGLNTILGSGSITVTGSNSAGFTIAGPDGLNTILGAGGTTVSGNNATGYTINTPQGLNTILGSGSITVTGSNSAGFTIAGANSATTLVGVSGLTVLGIGSTQSVSGAGLVVLQQSLVNAVGSASTASLGTGLPVFKALIRIPVGVKNISGSLNAYTLGGTTANFRVEIVGATPSDLTGVTSTLADNFQSITDINVSGIAGTAVLVKVYANVATAGEAAYIQGITLTVKD
ncbi:MAG: hypothetical protein EAZ53_12225 [Bacteroidetes bacterium]|nr:MAG: hypothetical protein EAZ53_12225 [Bacteroidota bacterium]